MKTRAEIEAAMCEAMRRFEREFMGRVTRDVHAYLIGDLLVIRLQGVMTAAEQHLVQTSPAEKGRNLFKQVRIQLFETARPILDAMVHEVCGVEAISLHYDISTATGEEIAIFTLAASPLFREETTK